MMWMKKYDRFRKAGRDAGGIKTTETGCFLNWEHLSFFSKTLIITSCTKYQLEGCMLEAVRVASASTTRLDSANETSEGCAHIHDEILAHRSKETEKPVGAPLYQRREHSQMWKAPEATHLHTVVQKPGEKKNKKVRRGKEWSKDLKLLENTDLMLRLNRWRVSEH